MFLFFVSYVCVDWNDYINWIKKNRFSLLSWKTSEILMIWAVISMIVIPIHSFPIGIPPPYWLWLSFCSLLLFITFKPLLYVITRKHFFIIIWLRVKCGPPSAYQCRSGSGDSSGVVVKKKERERKGALFYALVLWSLASIFSVNHFWGYSRQYLNSDCVEHRIHCIYSTHDIHHSLTLFIKYTDT